MEERSERKERSGTKDLQDNSPLAVGRAAIVAKPDIKAGVGQKVGKRLVSLVENPSEAAADISAPPRLQA